MHAHTGVLLRQSRLAVLSGGGARPFVAAEELICPRFHTLTQLNTGLGNVRVTHLMPRSRQEDGDAKLLLLLLLREHNRLNISGRADATVAHSRRHLALLPAGPWPAASAPSMSLSTYNPFIP